MSFSAKVKGELGRYTEMSREEALAQISAMMKVSGTIGFIDLIAPHVVRRVFGSKHKYVIPMSFVFGGCLMVISDLIARTVVVPSELPVGAVTALIGAPFFAYIYFKNKR